MNATILVADDEPMLRALLEHKLHNRGYRVVAVADGAAVLACLDAVRPDLIVLDAMMPGLDGFEVLRRLKADPVTASITCIAVSANAMPQDIERALQAGMSDYWTKPLDLQAFMAALDRMFK